MKDAHNAPTSSQASANTTGNRRGQASTGGLQGTAWAAGLALLAGLGLSGSIVAVSVFGFHNTDTEQLLGIQAFIGGLFAFVSTMLFAVSHNREDAKNLEYAGKLVAVALLAFTLVAAQGPLDSDVYNALLSGIIAVDTVLIIVLLTIRLTRPKEVKELPYPRKAM